MPAGVRRARTRQAAGASANRRSLAASSTATAFSLDTEGKSYDVLLETGIRIQPLPIWEEEWAQPEAYSNPRLLDSIRREGVRL